MPAMANIQQKTAGNQVQPMFLRQAGKQLQPRRAQRLDGCQRFGQAGRNMRVERCAQLQRQIFGQHRHPRTGCGGFGDQGRLACRKRGEIDRLADGVFGNGNFHLVAFG